MESVKLTFDPFKDTCSISLNGEVLASQSALNTNTGNSILDWAGNIMNNLSVEINDDFEMTVVGTDFEKYFLDDLRKTCPDCKRYETGDFSVKVDLMDRFQQTMQQMKKLGIPMDGSWREKLYSPYEINLNPNLVVRVQQPEEATVAIAGNNEEACRLARVLKGKLIFCVAQQAAVKCLPNRVSIWYLPSRQIYERMDAYLQRFAIPRFMSMAEHCSNQTADKALLRSIHQQTSIHVPVRVELQDHVMEGQTIRARLFCGKPAPSVRLDSSDSSVAEIRGGQVLGVKAGQTEIRCYRDKESQPFQRIHLTVTPDRLLKAITLSLPQELQSGNCYPISCMFIPENAIDIEKTTWTTSDSQIAWINEKKELVAESGGKVRLTVQGTRVSGSLDVEIQQNPTHISVEPVKLTMGIGEVAEVRVKVYPENSREVQLLSATSNPEVADIIGAEGEVFQVRAEGIENSQYGRCNLEFTVDGIADLRAACQVEVRIQEPPKRGLLFMTALLLLTEFAASFRYPDPAAKILFHLGFFGSLVSMVLGTIKKKKDFFWHLIMVILCAGWYYLIMSAN